MQFFKSLLLLFTISLLGNLAPAKQPNVLMIVIDDLADYVTRDTYPGVLAQNIDLLATESLSFQNSHCPAPICVPTRTATFSGKNPWNTGSYYNQPTTWGHPQMEGIESLPETFQKNGYITFGAGKLFHQGPSQERMEAMWDDQSHMNGGFGPWKPNPDGTPGRNFSLHHAWTGPDEDFPDVRNTNAAIDFLEQEHDAPFFLSLGIYRPHSPLIAPKRFFDLYNAETLPLPPGFIPSDLDDLPQFGKEIAAGRKKMDPENDEDYREKLRAYLACITFMDWNVGRVLDTLIASPHFDNTIIVFWSDHGFHYGEKYHHAKSTLWDQGTNSSLMIRVPGLTLDGEVSQKPVGLIDIFPTLVDLCQLDNLPSQTLDGQSLRPLLSQPNFSLGRPALTSHGPHSIGVRSERYRYIRYADGSEEFYDHADDLHEFKNRIDDPAYTEEIESLRRWYPKYWAIPIQNDGYRLW